MNPDLQNVSSNLDTYQPVTRMLLQHPHEGLSEVSRPIIDDIKTNIELQRLLNDMVKTMQEMRAVGLAAIQIGYKLRCFVATDGSKVYKVINPSLKEVSAETEVTKEGCLSFLGLTVDVRRPKTCVVEYFDENGDKQVIKADGMLGRVMQHELNHLDGLTFMDVIPKVQKNISLERFRKIKKKVAKIVARMTDKL